MIIVVTVMTTKGGPQPHVQRARNFISSSERPCCCHAARKRHDESPIESQAIYVSAYINRRIRGPTGCKRRYAGKEPGSEVRRRTWFDTPTRFCNQTHS
jgi:hypothetical protein